jgi:hypothetical protein
LAIGTEVKDSCQSLYSAGSQNRALLGYVLDGKYRALLFTNENGEILARRMMRILWDEEGETPVLFLEKEYLSEDRPSKAARKGLVDFAISRAKELGMPLVCESSSVERAGNEPYTHQLESYGCVAPCEYVDTNRIGLSEGEYTIYGDMITL